MQEAPRSEGNMTEHRYGSSALEASQHAITNPSFIDASVIHLHEWFEALSLPPLLQYLVS